jgi:hypothetical protein
VREADHLPQECVELYLHFPNTASWRGVELKLGFIFIRNLCRVTKRGGRPYFSFWSSGANLALDSDYSVRGFHGIMYLFHASAGIIPYSGL